MTSLLSSLRVYLGRTSLAAVDTVIGVIEQALSQVKLELDGRTICALNDTTTYSTGANTTLTTLRSYIIPAGQLNNDDSYTFRFDVFAVKPNTDTVDYALSFNGIVIDNGTTAVQGGVNFTDTIVINAGHWLSTYNLLSGVVDFTQDVEIKLTAQNYTATADDFQLRLLLIEILKTLA